MSPSDVEFVSSSQMDPVSTVKKLNRVSGSDVKNSLYNHLYRIYRGSLRMGFLCNYLS